MSFFTGYAAIYSRSLRPFATDCVMRREFRVIKDLISYPSYGSLLSFITTVYSMFKKLSNERTNEWHISFFHHQLRTIKPPLSGANFKIDAYREATISKLVFNKYEIRVGNTISLKCYPHCIVAGRILFERNVKY